MEGIKERAKSIEHSIAALIRQNKVNSVIFSLVIPMLVGFFVTYYADLSKINPVLFWLPVIIMVILAMYFAYVTYDVKLAPEIYLELDKSQKTIEALQSNVRFLTDLQEHAYFWNGIVGSHVISTDGSPNAFLEMAREICEVLTDNREEIFGIRQRELWAFKLYIYRPSTDLLCPVWGDKHRHHPSPQRSRSWAPGQGHVGIAFSQGETKICPDAEAPGVRGIFTGQNDRDYDQRAYRSFASQPVGTSSVGNKPYGVLIATSDQAERFNVATALALRHAAGAIASLIQIKYDIATLERVCASCTEA